MTPKQRAITALNLGQPDQVPTFELEFQLEEEMFGKKFIPDDLTPEVMASMGSAEKEKRIYEVAEYMAEVYTALEYAIIPAYGPGDKESFRKEGIVTEDMRIFFRALKEMMGDKALLGHHGDGTFSIPDGENMLDMVYEIADYPEKAHEKAKHMADLAIKRNHGLREAGIDTLLLCSDYCFNSGPFFSPAMFGEFVQPYLAAIIEDARAQGFYTIKHTDGNIMPILDQLVECNPHALHSLDPMAGVDIKEVKQLVGDKVCLCGNVHCAALQTGTDQEVTDSATYCLTHAKPGGGYIFATSNIPFKGMPPERYEMILKIWKAHRDYA